LAAFVRCRDLTCRWPGCDTPAPNCDLDHTIPYSRGGPTHAAKVSGLCCTIKFLDVLRESRQSGPRALRRR